MVREFELPDVGEGVAEGELVSWLVDPGETVTEDQPVAEVETDKALVEVPSPVDGTVRELHYEEGDVIPVGSVFVTFDVAGEPTGDETDRGAEAAGPDTTETGEPDATAADEPDATVTGERDATAAGTEDGATAAGTEDGATEVGSADGATGAGGEDAVEGELAGSPEAIGADAGTPTDRVFAPPRVRRTAREEGVDLSSVAGSGPGGRLTAADVRAAASGGVPGEQPAEADATPAAETDDSSAAGVAAAEPTNRTRGGAEAAAEAGGASAVDAATEPPADVGTADRERTLAAPATRRIAREEGVDIDAVPPVEERNGEAFVTPEAVREYAEARRRAGEGRRASDRAPGDAASQAVDRGAVEAGEPAGTKGTEFAPGERERREPFRGVRKRIAEAMVESAYTAPHVTHHDEVDVTALVDAREELEPRAEERGIRLTYLPFVAKAVTAALKEYPEMNAIIDEANEEIVYRDYYNVGVATATDVGLMVPVVENVDEKGLLQIASETNELVEKARERTISPDELRGSTFTITNVGGIGGEYATPILNYPESGILATGEIRRKPRVVVDEDGTESIEPRSVLPLSLSFDHRLIDGAVGARFTNAVKERLENPNLLLLE